MPRALLPRLPLAALLSRGLCWGGLFGGGGLVGPGALQPYAGPRQSRGPVRTIHEFPVGFYLGGSSVAGMDGLYRRVERDHSLPHFAEHTYVNEESKWGMAHVYADGSEGHSYEAAGGGRMEWLIFDSGGRDRFGHAGGTLLPGAGPVWSHLRRPEFAGRFQPGERVRTRTVLDALWEANASGTVVFLEGQGGTAEGPSAPVHIELEGGQTFRTQAWRLRRADGGEVPLCRGGGGLCDCWGPCGGSAGYCSACDSAFGTPGACCKRGEKRDPAECLAIPTDRFSRAGHHTCVLTAEGGQEVVAEGSGPQDPADELPWQVVGIMSEGQLNDLLRQKREHDERARRASQDMADSLPRLPSHGDEGPGRDFVPEPGLRELCGDGRAPEALEGLLAARAAAAGSAGTVAALEVQRAFCLRRLSKPSAALDAAQAALVPFPRYGAALFEHALALLDSGRAAEAVEAFERVLVADPGWPGLQGWLLHAHARARRGVRAPVAGGICMGDILEAVAHYDGMWAAGELATVIGLGTCHAPILVRTRGGRKVNVQAEHFRRAGAREAEVVARQTELDHYATLQVQADFSPAELKRAYKDAGKRCHPDLGGSDAEFARVAEAHGALADPARRQAYDRGDDLPMIGDVALHLEVARRYFPADAGFQPFGDPLSDRSSLEARERGRAVPKRRRLERSDL